jgi:hypothetical protein
MKETASKLQKERREEECARCFIDWYNQCNCTQYELQRAEEDFPDLARGIRWDFVARDPRNPRQWLAIEIKRLIRANLVVQFDSWKRLVRHVTGDLCAKYLYMLNGTFLTIPGLEPSLAELGRNGTSQLRKALVEAIAQSVKGMKVGDKVDLGPLVLQGFSDWPYTDHLETQPQPHVVKKARELWLYKESDGGKRIDVPTAVDAFTSREAVKEATAQVLRRNKGGFVKANQQLKKAKDNGAKGTILLLDHDFRF